MSARADLSRSLLIPLCIKGQLNSRRDLNKSFKLLHNSRLLNYIEVDISNKMPRDIALENVTVQGDFQKKEIRKETKKEKKRLKERKARKEIEIYTDIKHYDLEGIYLSYLR